MIRSFYYHGSETPATDLSQEHMQAALADAGGVLWVDMSNADPDETEQLLTQVFSFHPLTISDCIDGVRHPKLHNYDKYIFLVVYGSDQDTPVGDVNTVELDVFVGPNFVVTHHPTPLPAIDRIAEQAMRDESTMNCGADVLAYEILHAVNSDHRSTVNLLSAAIAGVELEVLTAPTSQTLRRMHELRHENLKIRRLLLTQQDIMDRLATEDLQVINTENRPYFRELANLIDQMTITVDRLDGSIRDALQTHLSIVAGRTNSLLRLVAALVALLVPLTLLVVFFDMRIDASSVLSRPYLGVTVTVITLVGALITASYIYRRG